MSGTAICSEEGSEGVWMKMESPQRDWDHSAGAPQVSHGKSWQRAASAQAISHTLFTVHPCFPTIVCPVRCKVAPAERFMDIHQIPPKLGPTCNVNHCKTFKLTQLANVANCESHTEFQTLQQKLSQGYRWAGRLPSMQNSVTVNFDIGLENVVVHSDLPPWR